MLHADDELAIALMPRSLRGLFTGRYALVSARRVLPPRWRAKRIEAIYTEQFENPVAMFRNGDRALWYFHHRFYWSDNKLDAGSVKTLALAEERRFQQTIHAAGNGGAAEEEQPPWGSRATGDTASTAVFARHVRSGQ